MNRQNIVDTLKTTLKNVEGIKSVYEWPATNLSEKELPALIVKDPGSKTSNNPSGSYIHSLSIDVDIVVSDKKNTMPTLRKYMKEVLKKLGELQDSWVCYGQFDGDEVSVQHGEHVFAESRMKFTFTYETPSWEL